jgi:UDP-N-acetylglucosamine 2-epimerase (non-hydrolysing)
MFSKIAIVLGTRPEAIKLIPVYKQLQMHFPAVALVSTGQHQTMLEQIFTFFDVRPDLSLDVMQPNQSLGGLTARLSDMLTPLFREQQYDLVIVQGDTTTAMVASLMAFYQHIPVAHVEAGLRTYNKFSPFPEEVNRQIIGRIADFHFAPTQKAADILIKEGLNHVYCVGNTVIDSLLLCLEKVRNNEAVYRQQFDMIHRFQKLVLITGHRRENFGEGFEGICAAIKELAALYPNFLFYYPVHLNPNVKEKVYALLSGLSNVFLGNPLPYDELVYLMSRSFIILTDSGGIQEEAPSLNVPLLVMRNTTERPEGIDAGCSVLVGTDKARIVSTFRELVEDQHTYIKMARAGNPYGDGRTASRIASILNASS